VRGGSADQCARAARSADALVCANHELSECSPACSGRLVAGVRARAVGVGMGWHGVSFRVFWLGGFGRAAASGTAGGPRRAAGLGTGVRAARVGVGDRRDCAPRRGALVRGSAPRGVHAAGRPIVASRSVQPPVWWLLDLIGRRAGAARRSGPGAIRAAQRRSRRSALVALAQHPVAQQLERSDHVRGWIAGIGHHRAPLRSAIAATGTPSDSANEPRGDRPRQAGGARRPLTLQPIARLNRA
jgi:hypothetical protein